MRILNNFVNQSKLGFSAVKSADVNVFSKIKFLIALQVLSASGGQIIAVQNPALSMSGALRASSPTSSSVAAQDSKNLVNLLNMSRRVASGQQAAAAAAAAAAVAAAASAGNGKDHNAKKPTTIIHSDDEEMTFKQEPASPLAASGNISPPRANGK